MEKLNVMILGAGAGGGHNRAGEALKKAFMADGRTRQAMFVDCLDYTNDAFKEIYSRSFLEAVRKAPTLWGWAYEKTDVPWRDANLREWWERINAQPLVRRIRNFAPAACVCTHFMPAMIISRLMTHDKFRTHLSVVVTDYYVHAAWLTDLFCRYFVPHEEGKVQLLKLGFPEERVAVSGIPIDPVFAQSKDCSALLKKFDLQPDLPRVLMSAGSVGKMAAEEMIALMETITTPCQIIILCGRHDKLKSDLQERIAARRQPYPVMRAVGFTEEMDEWMTVADLLIGKPGGLTLTESLAKGLPMVIWDPIPGQEVYNSVFLLENGAAVAPTSRSTLGFKVDAILGSPERLQAMKAAAGRLVNARAAENIVDTVLSNLAEPCVKVVKNSD
ncbi:MAG: MGDG synthase family glycosyltransferase [Anaerohalosphaeraceae bacterium]|jgi:processive 1,2-diacylglycerol beta-glucosyltransferase